jgi:hypothetical protein
VEERSCWYSLLSTSGCGERDPVDNLLREVAVYPPGDRVRSGISELLDRSEPFPGLFSDMKMKRGVR